MGKKRSLEHQGSMAIVLLGDVQMWGWTICCVTEGWWLIYDHYVSVRELKPKFCSTNDAIEEVVDWGCVSDLPIEYYDVSVLTFIRNCVGSTMNVDRNTLSKEQGKYARLCVQVDPTKPLLAMFSIEVDTAKWNMKAYTCYV